MATLPKDKESQEDKVLLALLSHLWAGGLEAELIERPDRIAKDQRRHPEVTSDALVLIRGDQEVQEWAVDVMALASPSDHHVVLNGLHQRLDVLAKDHSLIIEIEGESPSPDKLQGIAKAASRGISGQGRTGRVEVEELRIGWRPAGAGEQPELVVTAMLMASPSPLLTDQIVATLREPLTKKATVQARRAHAAGCGTAVVIDWAGHAGIAQGTHWLPRHAGTVQQSVSQVLGEVEHVLDAVLLLDRDDEWHIIEGEFPGFD